MVDKNQNFILYICTYCYMLLASYLTTTHHYLSLLDHLFNSLYAILTSLHHFTYSIFYSPCYFTNMFTMFTPIIHVIFRISYYVLSIHCKFKLCCVMLLYSTQSHRECLCYLSRYASWGWLKTGTLHIPKLCTKLKVCCVATVAICIPTYMLMHFGYRSTSPVATYINYNA